MRPAIKVMFCVATSHNRLLRNSVVSLVRAFVISHRFYRQSAISVKLSNNKMTSENARQPTQVFDYFLVLDFEATCDQDKKPQPQVIMNELGKLRKLYVSSLLLCVFGLAMSQRTHAQSIYNWLLYDSVLSL